MSLFKIYIEAYTIYKQGDILNKVDLVVDNYNFYKIKISQRLVLFVLGNVDYTCFSWINKKAIMRNDRLYIIAI